MKSVVNLSLALFFSVAALLSSPLGADELEIDQAQIEAQSSTKPESQPTRWKPSEPLPKDFDWIMLVSGEWLKGELNSLYSDVVQFDSDELDLLTLDWDDVSVIKTSRPKEILLTDQTIYFGYLVVKQGKVTIIRGHKSVERSRGEIVSIADREASFWKQWDGGITLSADIKDGNLDQKDFTIKFSADRRTAKTRFLIDFLGRYGVLEGETIENNRRLTSSIDWFFSPRWFLRPVQVELFSDYFQGIDARYTYASAIGFNIIDNDDVLWEVHVGPGYQITEYDRDELPPEAEYREETFVGSFGTSMNWDITGDVEMDAKYDLQAVSEESGKYNHHAEVGVSIDFLGDFDLDVRYMIDRVEEPVINAGGVPAEKQDSRLMVGLGYDF